jgi:two-component system nitrate/nitrite response regulator NarL
VALTKRETEVLSLVATGQTTRAIAAELRISEATVKWHVQSAMRKLGASSRAEAVAIAVRRGLLPGVLIALIELLRTANVP